MVNLKNDASDEQLLLQIAPNDIDFFNKLVEGYDNLSIITTIDAKLGKMALWVTEHTKKEVLAILKCLPIPVKFLSQDG